MSYEPFPVKAFVFVWGNLIPLNLHPPWQLYKYAILIVYSRLVSFLLWKVFFFFFNPAGTTTVFVVAPHFSITTGVFYEYNTCVIHVYCCCGDIILEWYITWSPPAREGKRVCTMEQINRDAAHDGGSACVAEVRVWRYSSMRRTALWRIERRVASNTIEARAVVSGSAAVQTLSRYRAAIVYHACYYRWHPEYPRVSLVKRSSLKPLTQSHDKAK